MRNKADITGETLGISEVNGHCCCRLPGLWATGANVRVTMKKTGLETRSGALPRCCQRYRCWNRQRSISQQGKAQLLGAWAGELLAEELRLAQQNLSEITGEFTSDDLLGRDFLQLLYW